MTDPSDEFLVSRFVDGDESAYSLLVERYQRRVYAICLRYFGNPADAEDAAQDAFVSLYRRAGTFSGTAKFSTWMYRVAVNACNDLARKRSRRPQLADADPTELADEFVADDVLANRELRMELRAALDTLDAAHREAVVLHTVQGVPYHQIAELQGVAVGTVKSRVHRGHAKLAEALTHQGREQRPADQGRQERPADQGRQGRPGGVAREPSGRSPPHT